MKNAHKYNIGDMIMDKVYAGLITNIEKNGTPHVVTILWAANAITSSTTTIMIDNWIETCDVKHYSVVE